MYDYKFREVKPNLGRRKPNRLWRVALVFVLALLIGLVVVYLPSWLTWNSLTGGSATDPNVIPLVLPSR